MKKRSAKDRLVGHLRSRYMTQLDGLRLLGIFTLGQRVSELKREGHIVVKKWKELPSGKRVMSYRIVSPTGWTA
jgi:hypothetical protein